MQLFIDQGNTEVKINTCKSPNIFNIMEYFENFVSELIDKT